MGRLTQATVELKEAPSMAHVPDHGPLLGRLCPQSNGLALFLSPAVKALVGETVKSPVELGQVFLAQDAGQFLALVDELVQTGKAIDRVFRCRPDHGLAALRIVACADPSDPDAKSFLFQFEPVDLHEAKDQPLPAIPFAQTLGFHQLLCAVEEAPFGFALYDQDDRLLFGNRIFRSVLAKPISENLVGKEFAEIAQLCLKGGTYDVGADASYLADRIESHRRAEGHIEQFLSDGTIERIVERRTATGGWVGIHVDITELYAARERATAAEDESQRMRDRLATAIDLLPDALILFDSDDRVLLANREYSELYQNAATMLAKRQSFEEVVTSSYRNGEYGDVTKLPPDFIERRLRAHRGEEPDFLYTMYNGKTIRIVERRLPDGGTVGLHVDLTAIHSAKSRAEIAESEARLARAQLEGAIGGMRDGFAFWDADERLVLCNKRYGEIYSVLRPVLVKGASFEDVLRYGVVNGQHPEAFGREDEWIAEALSSWRQRRNSTVLNTPDGRVMRVYDQFEPGVGTVSVHVDITEIMQARKEAEAANRTKSMFLAQMSHEIRTPLTGILGLAQLLFDELPDGPARCHAGNIARSGETLLAILNDLLDMAKIEMGKIEFESAPFDPANVAQRLTAIYAPQAGDREIVFENRTPPTLAPRLGDAHRIMQIISNLLSNAVKFTHTGHVRLTVSDTDTGALRVVVEDTGIGMDEETLSRIFRPFEQADASTTRRYGGTGLGMSIIDQLVALMGGTVDVTSTPAVGTTVCVTLPLPFAKSAAALADQQAVDQRPIRASILLADDNAIIRDILAGLLEKLGCTVTQTEDGGQAIEAFAASDFDLVLLDISMPVMNGQDVVRAIGDLARTTGRHLPPCVAITANTMKHQVDEYLANGFSAHLAKPFRRADLEQTLRRLLEADRISQRV